MTSTNQVNFQDLGLIDYKEAWDYQEKLLKDNVLVKQAAGRDMPRDQVKTQHHLLFCEHPHVYTLGKSGKDENLLLDETERVKRDVQYYKINRGGDITYHGPGQITGYPIFDLERIKPDLGWYLRTMEEVMIRVLAEYGLTGGRIEGATGVWLDIDSDWPRKICAFGVRASRWVTMHGFALNVNTDLSYFGHIIPCGIDDKGVTSLAKELGKDIDIEEVKAKLRYHFADLFNLTL